MKSERS